MPSRGARHERGVLQVLRRRTLNRRALIEACVGSATDAAWADACGADRIEISVELEADGLTPPMEFIEAVVAGVRAPVVVLVRARPGGFVYDEAEVGAMCRDAEAAAALGAEGVAIGALEPDGGLDLDAMGRMAEAARAGNPDVALVCHRAFDHVPDFGDAIAQLEIMRFSRVLTSGGRPTAAEGAQTIARLQRASTLELVPAGGVRADTIRAIIEATGCRSIHGTFRLRGDRPACAIRLDADELRAAIRQA